MRQVRLHPVCECDDGLERNAVGWFVKREAISSRGNSNCALLSISTSAAQSGAGAAAAMETNWYNKTTNAASQARIRKALDWADRISISLPRSRLSASSRFDRWRR